MMTRIDGCRSCGAGDLKTILDLGEVPLANALLDAADLERDEATFPLTLAVCPACSLVQIRETVDPALLFSEYPYFSSFSTTMLAHAAAAAESYCRRYELGRDSLVIEVASNDGYLLERFMEAGVPVLGIEPAANVASVAAAKGVPTRVAFFGRQLAEKLAAEGLRADLIVANNVLAHVADTNGVAAGFAALLRDDGHAVCEFPYVLDMIDRTEFDTIYHEHLCYFSLHAVRDLFARHGLTLIDVERLAIHGGSLRIHLQPARTAAAPSAAVAALLAEEARRSVAEPACYRPFATAVERLRRDLMLELERRRAGGERLAAYGASAKGSTLMNTFGIGPELLDFIADRSTVKQGRYAPGNHLPILSPAALTERRPEAVLLLTWNFADEILAQQADYLAAGGCFIIPIPEVRVVGKEVRP